MKPRRFRPRLHWELIVCGWRGHELVGTEARELRPQDRLVVYTSNVFAVLGLRSLFFLLHGAVNQFEYLQQGIAIVLIFIGLKMLAEAVHVYIPVWISLMVIVVCLFGSILYSVQNAEKKE